jgi:hypothetical protein
MEKQYYILEKTYQSDTILFWKPNRGGYTCNLGEAGVYNEVEAKELSRLRASTFAVPAEKVFNLSFRSVSKEYLITLEQNCPFPRSKEKS